MNGKISNFAQLAYARRYTLIEGRETGLRVVEVNNGVLRFLLNESKALDVMQLWHEGTNVSFLSKNGFTARETPFSKRFEGGMLYTCGLDSVSGREGFDLHGTLHNIPAKITGIRCDEAKIEVTAEIEDTELFGKNLLLRRSVKTSLGSDSVCVCDRLINRGAKAENYCLLYHINLGYPMLDEGVTISSDIEEAIPRTDWAKKRLSDRARFSGAVDGEEERCYFLRHKTPEIHATNPRLRKRFTLAYSGDTLPCFVQWNSAASGDYALGLEPATTLLDDRFAYRTIEPNEEIAFSIELKISCI